jgi:hypothetical protein
MIPPAIKTTVLFLGTVFIQSIFAQFIDGYCEEIGEHPHEFIRKDKLNGVIRTTIEIHYYKDPHILNHPDDGNRNEKIITIHNEGGQLLFSKHYIWEGKMLVQAIDDGIVRNIVSGRTPCDFIIVEPSGDSIFFHLDPEKKLDTSVKIRNDNNFFTFIYGSNFFHHNKPSRLTTHDAIIYQRYSFCKFHHEIEKSAEYTNDTVSLYMTKESTISIKEDYNFLSYTSSYKYYAIAVVCVAIAGVAVVRKRRKGGKA